MINTSHQNIRYWRNNPTSASTKKLLKYNVITLAGEVFDLSADEMEVLANKAGLSLSFKRNAFGKGESEQDFAVDFNELISLYPGKLIELCDIASVSDRMLRHLKRGNHLKKEPILAVLIAMGQNIENIQRILKKAGYILSKSVPNDMVIMWMLENEPQNDNGTNLNYRINEALDSLDLPLLMTREKGK